ncbi:DUF4198 domain-containing protein [Gracilimonas mengyeensis]|nr:DUF4198 domain-containing protein [Gracilimonas mengyeensis]
MKKLLLVLVLIFCGLKTTIAHNLWIETGSEAQIGEAHEVRIYYGEYTYDYYETVSGNFADVADFTLWLVKPGGEKVELEAKPEGETFYSASFTPKERGSYRVQLVSNKTTVVDWTEYGLGVLKPDFYATADVLVGEETDLKASLENAPLQITPDKTGASAGDHLRLTITFKEKPLAEQEVMLSVADQWTKTVQTDENGEVVFELPWEGQYVIETVHTEEAPGSYQGDEYEAIRHTATYTFTAK